MGANLMIRSINRRFTHMRIAPRFVVVIWILVHTNAAQWIAGILAGETVELIYNFRNETSHSAKRVALKKHSSSEAKAAPAGMPVIQGQRRTMEHCHK